MVTIGSRSPPLSSSQYQRPPGLLTSSVVSSLATALMVRSRSPASKFSCRSGAALTLPSQPDWAAEAAIEPPARMDLVQGSGVKPASSRTEP